ncbi:MAG: hypothetical protein V4522_08125 [Pseudomonadota bacterium]
MTRRARPDPATLPDNVVSIAAALDAPVDAPALAQAGDAAPFGGYDEDDGLDRPRIPPGCPVKPLGIGTDGQTCFYLNVLGQLVALGPRDHGKNNFNALFAPQTHLLSKYWPRWSEPKVSAKTGEIIKPSEIVGFKQDEASEALIGACGMAGIFDPQGRVRGRGAHKGRGGALIVHFGDKVMVGRRRINGSAADAEWFPTGLIDGYVYPAGEATPRPHHEPVDEQPVEQLLALIGTWPWRRRLVDQMLALGWIAQTSISGALPWRSHLFVTGGRGTGKSSFNGKDGLIDRLLGRAVLRTGGATEAAVRQKLRNQTIAVIFDEFEPNAFNAHKLSAVLELARVASSGSDMHKGQSDHQAADFTLNSCFQFSAILMPQMEPQDRSRFAVLELEPLPRDARKLDLESAKLPAIGAALMRRMFDGWWRYKETYDLYHDALTSGGHDARGADTFGTLLACADLALYDHVPDADLLDHWARLCAPESLAEINDAVQDHDACLNHLRTTPHQFRGGDLREGLGTWIGRAVRAGEGDQGARDKIQELGLKIVNRKPLGPGPDGRERWGAIDAMPGQPTYLAVALSHRELATIYGPTKWAGGGWATTLARAPGATRGIKTKFARASLTAVLVPIELVIDPDEVPAFVACPGGPLA